MLSAVRVLSGSPAARRVASSARRVELHDPSVSEPPDVADRHLEPRAAGASRRGLVRDHVDAVAEICELVDLLAEIVPLLQESAELGAQRVRALEHDLLAVRVEGRGHDVVHEQVGSNPSHPEPSGCRAREASRRLPRTLRGELRRSGTPLQTQAPGPDTTRGGLGGRAPAAAACRVEPLGSRRQLLLLEGRAISGDELKPFLLVVPQAFHVRRHCIAHLHELGRRQSWLAGL